MPAISRVCATRPAKPISNTILGRSDTNRFMGWSFIEPIKDTSGASGRKRSAKAIHCTACGQEFVERDDTGKPIRWDVCRSCPYRHPWHSTDITERAREGDRS